MIRGAHSRDEHRIKKQHCEICYYESEVVQYILVESRLTGHFQHESEPWTTLKNWLLEREICGEDLERPTTAGKRGEMSRRGEQRSFEVDKK